MAPATGRLRRLLPYLVVTVPLIVTPCMAQTQRPDSAARAATAAASAADHRGMMEMLGITTLRPGPSGNPQAPNAANADEARVPAHTLPDPLVLKDGRRVATARR